jgi:uncharacterized protein (DUF58 family)
VRTAKPSRKRKVRKLPPPLPGQAQRRSTYLRHKDLARFKNLLFAARTMVEGIYSGRHRSPFKGSSPEFIEYKVYTPGDPVDAIDWKAYARTDRHYIRLTEKQTDMNCYLMLDCSGSMAYDGHRGKAVRVSKFFYGCLLTAAIAYLIIKQGDKVSLTLFDREIRKHFPCGGTFPHLYKLLNELERHCPTDETGVADMLRVSHGLCRQKGLLLVISDFYDDPAELFKSLSLYTHRGFEIILFHLMHADEHRLPDVDNVRFMDLESAEQMTCNAADLRAAYDAQVAEFLRTLRSGARARGIDYHFLTTDTPYDQVLQRFLLKRNTLMT